jgi:hypothetical protein
MRDRGTRHSKAMAAVTTMREEDSPASLGDIASHLAEAL